MFISLLAQPSSFKRKETSIYSCFLHPALPVVKQQTGFLLNLSPHDYRVRTTGDACEGRTERSVSKAHPSLCSRFWMKEEGGGNGHLNRLCSLEQFARAFWLVHRWLQKRGAEDLLGSPVGIYNLYIQCNIKKITTCVCERGKYPCSQGL